MKYELWNPPPRKKRLSRRFCPAESPSGGAGAVGPGHPLPGGCGVFSWRRGRGCSTTPCCSGIWTRRWSAFTGPWRQGRPSRSLGLRCGWHHRHLSAHLLSEGSGSHGHPLYPRPAHGRVLPQHRRHHTAAASRGPAADQRGLRHHQPEGGRLCRGIGMDVIITDHHECKEELPQAVAVVNPHRSDCPYPFKQLAGVGVALKLVLALTPRSTAPRCWRNTPTWRPSVRWRM